LTILNKKKQAMCKICLPVDLLHMSTLFLEYGMHPIMVSVRRLLKIHGTDVQHYV